MKKLIFVATLLLLPTIASANFNTNLSYGMSSNDVFQLQDVLQEEGCLTHSSTGYFGLLTVKAVQCFQAKNIIPRTGYVGAQTRGALNKIVNSILASSTQAQIEEVGTTTPPTIVSITQRTPPAAPVSDPTSASPQRTPQPSSAPLLLQLSALNFDTQGIALDNSTLRLVSTNPIDFSGSSISGEAITAKTLFSGEKPESGCMGAWGVCGLYIYDLTLNIPPKGNADFNKTKFTFTDTHGNVIVFRYDLSSALPSGQSLYYSGQPTYSF